MKDDLGDRMKHYEGIEAQRRLLPDLPVVARIDGRKFSRFTKPFDKPFDTRLTSAMDITTAYLVEKTHANVGYTQSDEITLIWHVDRSENPAAQMLFDGRVQKLCSVLAGMATARFIRALDQAMVESPGEIFVEDSLPHFDCRVWNVPSQEEAANALFWRFLDASKNAVSAFTRCYVGHNTMQGLNAVEQINAAHAAGAPKFEEAVTHGERFGRAFQRRTRSRCLTSAELQAIPEKHRPSPDQEFVRSSVEEIGTYWYGVTNLPAVIFEQAGPEISRRENA